MASLLDGLCTCEGTWQGGGNRPACPNHEAPLPKGKARRKSDGQVVDVLASAGVIPQQREPGTWSPDLEHMSGVVNVH